MNLKVDPLQLKEESLKMIEEHNSIEGNRRVSPIDGYGNMNTTRSLFWALRSDGNRDSCFVGFTYKWEKLVAFWKDDEIASIEEALNILKEELSQINSRDLFEEYKKRHPDTT